MRQLDTLVTEYPDIFKCIGKTDIDKTYSMPKSRISYRKPRSSIDSKIKNTPRFPWQLP
jgi:hypothetical protein